MTQIYFMLFFHLGSYYRALEINARHISWGLSASPIASYLFSVDAVTLTEVRGVVTTSTHRWEIARVDETSPRREHCADVNIWSLVNFWAGLWAWLLWVCKVKARPSEISKHRLTLVCLQSYVRFELTELSLLLANQLFVFVLFQLQVLDFR